MRADFDLEHDQRGRRGDSAIRGLIILAEAALVVGAVAILYLAFRGPSGHPPARAVAAPTSSPSPYTTGGAGVGQGHSSQPAAVPVSTSAAAAPSPSPSPSANQAAGPLGARAQSYLAGRRGRTGVAVYDLSTGQQWTLGPQAPQAEASVVNLEILQAVLNQRRVRRTVMSLTEQELTPPLIEQSDNGAAATLWRDVGGIKGMRAFDHAARLTHTSPAPGWGQTTTTPQDQITLLRQLAQPSRVLDKNDQKYALKLLENITPLQRWGVPGGVPAGATVAFKSGLLPLNARQSDWQVNSIGWVSGGGRNYLLAMFSTGDPSEQYGISTLNHLGAMTWSALAPRHR